MKKKDLIGAILGGAAGAVLGFCFSFIFDIITDDFQFIIKENLPRAIFWTMIIIPAVCGSVFGLLNGKGIAAGAVSSSITAFFIILPYVTIETVPKGNLIVLAVNAAVIVTVLAGPGRSMMKEKKIIWLFPAVIFPHLLLAVPVIVLYIFNNAQGSAVIPTTITALLITVFFMLISTISTVIYFALVLKGRDDPLRLARAAMIIKLIQIPVYFELFVVGLMLGITLWLLPMVIILIIFIYITVLMTGSVSLAAIINASRENKCSIKSNIPIIIFQFFFCFDVITSVILYFKLKMLSEKSDEIQT